MANSLLIDKIALGLCKKTHKNFFSFIYHPVFTVKILLTEFAYWKLWKIRRHNNSKVSQILDLQKAKVGELKCSI